MNHRTLCIRGFTVTALGSRPIVVPCLDFVRSWRLLPRSAATSRQRIATLRNKLEETDKKILHLLMQVSSWPDAW